MIDIHNAKWTETSDPGVLEDHEIHLWRVFLNRETNSVSSLFDSLSPDEKRRADKYAFARDRGHFIVARGSLRKIIDSYLNIGPEKIRFSYNRFGKPSIDEKNCVLRFNISHSNGIGVIAIALNREVGVDIEAIKDDFDAFSIACSAFSVNEVARLRSFPSSLQIGAFFAAWTRKEACLKAMGDGLSSSPEIQSLVSSFNSENDVSFKTYVDGTPKNWSLTSLPTKDDFRIALAVQGTIGTIRYWQLAEN